MPKGLRRYYGQGHLHFLTFSCYRRLPLLGTKRAGNLFVHALGRIRERYNFSVVGYVVMPEHVHLLITEPAVGTPSLILKVLKQRVSRDRRRMKRRVPAGQLRLAFSKGDDSLPRFWQPRFYDFNVWSGKKIREKLQYLRLNPILRGLVANPQDWPATAGKPWSSWSFSEKGEQGLVPIDPML